MITTDVSKAVSALKKGEVVAIPTETVYGLAANALDSQAVAQIYALKQRPIDHPLIVHVPTLAAARELTLAFPPGAEKAAAHFWPGPLTLVLPKNKVVPDLTTGGMQSIALRIPQSPDTLEILKRCGFPLAAPSANPFGQISPTHASHVEQSFGSQAPLIFDGGPCRVGVESTIVSFLGEKPCVLRLGGIPLESLEAVLGPLLVAGKTDKAIAPGMLPQHYAPRTSLRVTSQKKERPPSGKRVGLLTFTSENDTHEFAAVEVLSPKASLEEAASRFYSALRTLDALKLDLILAHRFPDEGLGRALNDRLERASHLN
ncbi:threonylcarbamoyl-AMP synthase [bacterium]|nr:threonylcarbamoyl-AMP synthase [bacterium]